MRFLQLVILIFILISCKKENIYYYADHKQIKDSTVIRFVDEELEKLKINTKEKKLKIYTTLDSTSYKNNLDSIRNKIFEKSLHYSLKPEDKEAFDEWFREKIIVIDKQNGKVINYYSSFKNLKYDRNRVNLNGFRKIIRLGSLLNENPDAKVGENNLFNPNIQSTPQDSLKIKEREKRFLSEFNIRKLNQQAYFYNSVSFLDAIQIFQTLNNGIVAKPSVIIEVLNKNKTVYRQNIKSKKILNKKSLDKIQQNLKYYKKNSFGAFENQLKNTENILFFGYNNIDYFMMLDDGKYTYLIFNFSAVITDIEKKRIKMIPHIWMKKAGLRYYNAIRK